MKVNLDTAHDRHDDGPAWLRKVYWKQSAPFYVNPRGWLIHRVRKAGTYFENGRVSHHVIDYWCWNTSSSAPVEPESFYHDPPKDRLLCRECERRATDAGMPSADELTGRHVCIGKLRAVRICCQPDN